MMAADASARQPWGAEQLQALADALLYYCNFTVAMVAAIGLVMLYGIVHAIRKPKVNPARAVALILHAMSALYIATVAVAAFTLPKVPPNVHALEGNEWRLLGAYIFGTGLFYGVYEVTRIFAAPFRTPPSP